MKMNNGLFETWKRAKIQKDDTILGNLNLISEQYGYIIADGYGLHVGRKKKAYFEERYAEVRYNGFSSFQVSTVSSTWTVSEATIMMKQLKEATECAAELNIYLESLNRQLKNDFDQEMAEKMEVAK
jgi:hypothetical protein